ncbi:hypothetical protein ACIGHB_05180 [Streptomyces sp. NPDC085460]|uniref:hypothetical protein n=1 Tax=Streptomyces sp. NPDC085460 TaxID=3365723 RepID=UPI0037CDD002
MTSIAEINRTVIPGMESRAASRTEAALAGLKDKLTPDEIKEFKKGAEGFADGLGSILESIDTEGSEEPSFSIKLKGSAGPAFSHLLTELTTSALADPHHQLLRNSLLVSAVSAFEILFGRIARSLLEVNHSAIADSEYRFTFQELAEFDSMQDARDSLVERQVSKLLYSGVEDWDKWLQKASGGVSMNSFPVDWPFIREAFARRNLIIHADGIANHIYLSILRKIDNSRDWAITPGERLSVDSEYLSKVLDEMLALGRILSVAIGIKIKKDEARAFIGTLRRDIQRGLYGEHWGAVKPLAEYGLKCRPSRSSEIEFMIASWVARREIYGPDSIKDEVAKWDVSGLADEYSHQKYVLLGELDRAKKVMRKLISEDTLTLYEIGTDPLYAHIRGEFISSAISSRAGSDTPDERTKDEPAPPQADEEVAEQ